MSRIRITYLTSYVLQPGSSTWPLNLWSEQKYLLEKTGLQTAFLRHCGVIWSEFSFLIFCIYALLKKSVEDNFKDEELILCKGIQTP